MTREYGLRHVLGQVGVYCRGPRDRRRGPQRGRQGADAPAPPARRVVTQEFVSHYSRQSGLTGAGPSRVGQVRAENRCPLKRVRPSREFCDRPTCPSMRGHCTLAYLLGRGRSSSTHRPSPAVGGGLHYASEPPQEVPTSQTKVARFARPVMAGPYVFIALRVL